MLSKLVEKASAGAAERALEAYLLGSVEFEAALAMQRRLVFDISSDRSRAALLLCEHPPLITVGREGSWRHLLNGMIEPGSQEYRVRWVNRAGGCVLHLPGQLAVYPILPLDRLGLNLPSYLRSLQHVIIDLLTDFQIQAEGRGEPTGVWIGRRPIAQIGIAVRDWVAYHGVVFNINPDLELLRRLRAGGRVGPVPTSLERERRGPLRPALVRERFLEHFAARFGFSRTSLFFEHPLLPRKAQSHALATRS